MPIERGSLHCRVGDQRWEECISCGVKYYFGNYFEHTQQLMPLESLCILAQLRVLHLEIRMQDSTELLCNCDECIYFASLSIPGDDVESKRTALRRAQGGGRREAAAQLRTILSGQGNPTRHSGKRPPLGDNYFVEENSDARRSSVYCSHRATADMARRLSRRVAPSCVGVNNPSRLCAFYYEKNTVLRKHFVAYTTLRK